MKCYCRALLPLLILILAFFWDSGVWVKWVVIIAALLLFLLEVTEKCVCMPKPALKQLVVKKAVKKKPAKKKR